MEGEVAYNFPFALRSANFKILWPCYRRICGSRQIPKLWTNPREREGRRREHMPRSKTGLHILGVLACLYGDSSSSSNHFQATRRDFERATDRKYWTRNNRFRYEVVCGALHSVVWSKSTAIQEVTSSDRTAKSI
jgi:hypothetical protein